MRHDEAVNNRLARSQGVFEAGQPRHYHLVAGGQSSWYDYARYVIDFARQAGLQMKVCPDAIRPVPTSAFPTPAARPKNSRLDTRKLQHTFGLKLPDWQDGVRRLLTEILEKQ